MSGEVGVELYPIGGWGRLFGTGNIEWNLIAGTSYVKSWDENIPGRGNKKCKSLMR